MSIIPVFEIGIWNAWIFMIGFLLPPILFSKGEATSKRWAVSVPIKHEKLLNVISTVIMVAGLIYSIFLPLQLGKVWFFIGLIIFLIALVISLSASFYARATPTDKPFTRPIPLLKASPICSRNFDIFKHNYGQYVMGVSTAYSNNTKFSHDICTC